MDKDFVIINDIRKKAISRDVSAVWDVLKILPVGDGNRISDKLISMLIYKVDALERQIENFTRSP